ncbi:MAG: BrnA antitoxin family protein [Verrucomicrobia bacterium]|nr:BrnA antitoxin family protein [Verrucomicrobiota bacterium]
MPKNRTYVPDMKPEEAAEFDITKAQRVVFPNLKPPTKTISLRLPSDMLDQLKATANKRDVPYQSLLKIWLAERLASERQAA